MNRHMIYGCFGRDDDFSPISAKDIQVTKINFLNGKELDFGVGKALKKLEKFGIPTTKIGVDLLVLATHVYAADTRISRETEAQDGWTREIKLIVPVHDSGRWRDAELTIIKMLNFLTGDHWQIEFRDWPQGIQFTIPDSVNEYKASFDSISLFSGGLDSLVGVINMLEAGHTPLLISHAGESASSKAQQDVFGALKEYYTDSNSDRLRVWMQFFEGLVENVDSEKTTRARSFLFFAIAACAASGFPYQDTVIQVPENGLIALNVPLDPLRLGANSTRTTHPFYMARWNELLRIIGIDAQLINQFAFETKGEMIKNCKNGSLLKKIYPLSISCSSPTKSRWIAGSRGMQQCGYCLPCLIRRASLLKGFGEDLSDYTIPDLTKSIIDTRIAKGMHIRSFQFMINRLNTNPSLAKVLIHKPGPLNDEVEHLTKLESVYIRGMREVAFLLDGVVTKPS